MQHEDKRTTGAVPLIELIPDISLLSVRCAATALFLFSGVIKAVFWDGALQEFAALKLGLLPLIGTIVVQCVGAALLLAGIYPRSAALLLAGFTLMATVIAHPVWPLTPSFDQQQTTVFLEHMVIVASLLVISAHGGGRFSLFKSASRP